MNFNNKEINKVHLEELLNWTLKQTDNLQNLNKEILIERPESILILRLLLNKSQRKFSKLVPMSKGSLWNYENKLSKIREKTASKIVRNLSPSFTNFELSNNLLEDILKKRIKFQNDYSMSSERAKEIRKNVLPHNNHKKGIKTRSKNIPENDFELQMCNLLKNNNIPFELHGVLELKNRKFVIDFIIPHSKNPKIVVEVKQTKTERPRRVYDVLHYQSIIIDHRMRAIKKEFPEIKTVAIMSSKNIPIKKVSPYIQSEYIDTDVYFIDSTLDKFIEFVQNNK